MKLRLMSLELNNFMGIQNFKLDLKGANADVLADNGRGKTSLYSAFLWLLFDKNAEGKSSFEVKTLDADNNPLHGLEHAVEAVLEIGGETLTLKKVFQEKWTKRRGEAKATFTGHTTDYFIDGVPKQKKDFVERVNDIAKEDLFKLLTNPAYFNEQLHWQERRATLIEVCGDVSDGDVIASNSKLSKLPSILGKRALEDHRKVILSRRSEINKELDKLPVRISEVQRGLPDIKGYNAGTLDATIQKLRAQVQGKRQELSVVTAGGEAATLTKQVRELEGEALRLMNEAGQAKNDEARSLQGALYNLRKQRDEHMSNYESYQRSIRHNQEDIEQYEKRKGNLLQLYKTIKVMEFTFEQDENCPTCGQSLPTDQLKAAREKALADFNIKKSADMEENVREGKALANSIKELRLENEGLVEAAEKAKAEAQKASKELLAVEKTFHGRQGVEVATPDSVRNVRKQIEELQAEIAATKEGNAKAIDTLQMEIEDLEAGIASMEEARAQVDTHKRGMARIKELEADEKKLAAEFEGLEEELFLADLFVKTKVSLLEGKINSKFKHARFKMFKENINGGVEPCCEVLYGGVPYSGGLNRGHRIIVGLEICSVLSEHYNFFPPVIVDNCEAITDLPEMQTQLIRLIKPAIETDADREKYSKLVVKIV